MRPFFSFFLALCVFFFFGSAKAQDEKELEDIQKEIKQLSQDQKKLTHKKSAIEKNIRDREAEMSQLASEIQSAENNNAFINSQLNELTKKNEALQKDFNFKKVELTKLLSTIIRLEITPTEIIALQPESILSAARGSMVMESALPGIEKKLSDLNEQLGALNNIKIEIEAKRAQSIVTSNQLELDRERLSGLIQRQKTDLYNTNRDLQLRQIKLQKLAREASDVEELLSKISKLKNVPRPVSAPRAVKQVESRVNPTQRQAVYRPNKGAPSLPNTALSPGMPVNGEITVSFGQSDDIGARNNGWTILTSPSAIVSAPFSGVIKYAGTFKRYGQIVLIEHKSGYFSLIAGVEETFVLPETSVSKGAPIGRMGQITNSKGEVNLYYEVRYKGKPIDPKRLLSVQNL